MWSRFVYIKSAHRQYVDNISEQLFMESLVWQRMRTTEELPRNSTMDSFPHMELNRNRLNPYRIKIPEITVLINQGPDQLYRHLRRSYSRQHALATTFWMYHGIQSAVATGGVLYFIYYAKQGQDIMNSFLSRETNLSLDDKALLQKIADTIVEMSGQELLELVNEIITETVKNDGEDINKRIEFLQRMQAYAEEDIKGGL